jgi:signal transduction histidine kinase
MSYRFSEAYKTIERMAGKLRQADKQKDAFLLQTSHEFQTPLHGMINLSQNMLETGAGQLTTSQVQNLSVIRDTSRRLSALVHDILDMEKIKRDELSVQLSGVDVRVTVSLVFELLRHMIAGKKISLINAVPEGLPPVYADENRLKQIIHNLTGNAMKFTQEGSITVSAQVMGNQVKVLVEDTGAGIEPTQWNSVFQAFEQAHSPREYGGTGLGLYICRKLLHLMDGDIYIDWSEPDRGTGIAFTLPLAALDSGTVEVVQTTAWMEQASSKEEQPRPTEQGQAQQMAEPMEQPDGYPTLLAVDDEPANLQVLSRLFADQPYHVLLAANGREALDLLKQRSDIALVLLDVMMPKMSGYEVCQEIRKRYSLFEMPVILLTALHASEDIAAGFKAGANDFITKPFDASEVRVRTETLLQLKQSVEASFRAELDFLQSQIKPHFLYNSLNSIISLCQTDAPRAEKLITHLSNYLRKSFDPRPDSFILVQEELQLVEAYVEIEKARFEERLTVLYEVETQALSKRILPLTIQPLVENAIRHGVMKKEDGGTVRVTVRLVQGALNVEVWDDGVGMSREKMEQLGKLDPTARRQGVGFANIKRRLRHFCGVELEVESKEGEWTRFQFRLEA